MKKSFTTENWSYPPYNKESFQHVRTLFSTVKLTSEKENSNAFDFKEKEIANLRYQIKYPGFDSEPTVQDMLDKTHTDAFLVMKDGLILFEKYSNGMNQESIHLMNSVSKSFLGILIGVLIDEGLIDTQKLITEYLPDFEDTGFSGTTVQQALNMTGSVKYKEDYLEKETDFW